MRFSISNILTLFLKFLKRVSNEIWQWKKLSNCSNKSTSIIQKPSKKKLTEVIKWIARLINVSQKPILYVGQGMNALPESFQPLQKLADKACILVSTIRT